MWLYLSVSLCVNNNLSFVTNLLLIFFSRLGPVNKRTSCSSLRAHKQPIAHEIKMFDNFTRSDQHVICKQCTMQVLQCTMGSLNKRV